ncbi:S26 family signal peptidase [Roseiconus sp. JC912]|uniref:S26 family signal peptidase n=2 Tax=Pirellulaceae TaxID=2691357 RepID=UPI003A4C738B
MSKRNKFIMGTAFTLAVAAVWIAGFRLGSTLPPPASEHKLDLPADEPDRRKGELEPASPPKRFAVQGDSMSPTLKDGQQVTLSSDARRLSTGDLVAIHHNGADHIKRIAGLPGQTIDRKNGRLLVDGIRLEDRLNSLKPLISHPPKLLTVTQKPDDWFVSSEQRWLVLRSKNSHQADYPSPILDDYPENQSVRRTLNAVDRVILRLDSQFDGRHVLFHFEGVATSTQLVDGGAQSRFATAPPIELQPPAELSDNCPIAIELGSKVEADKVRKRLTIERDIEYRDDVSRRKVNYPTTLKESEYFVVGDNVPISVDSRDFGPIHADAIFGQVIKLLDSR